MSETAGKSTKAATQKTGKDARQAKLADALKKNLRRRKAAPRPEKPQNTTLP